MDKCLKAAGAGAEHVVKVQVFMTDITERPRINPRRIAYFGNNRPASTLVEVKGLVDPRMKVEIECQAYVESGASSPISSVWGRPLGRVALEAAARRGGSIATSTPAAPAEHR